MTQGKRKRLPTLQIASPEHDEEEATPPDERPSPQPVTRDAQLLAGLLATGDHDLDAFRRRHDLETTAKSDLQLARGLLEVIAQAVRDPDDTRWNALRTAMNELFGGLGGDEPTTISPPATQRRPGTSGEQPAEPHAHDGSSWQYPWGQAYAPGSLPPSQQPGTGAPHGGYGPGNHHYDPGHQLDDAPTPGAQEGGYEPPPPPSEPTQPNRSSEPASSPSPPPAQAPDSSRSFSSQEDSATNELSFFSHAHAFALTVEEYAGLCAERDHAPSRARAIARRYDIADERTLEALERCFELRFERNDDLRKRYRQAYDRFSTALRRRS